MSAHPPPPLCAHIFLAEFDIDKGSALKHQYPALTAVDEHLLAEHMLPDGAHDRTEDWTVFYLNQIPPLSVAFPPPADLKGKGKQLQDEKELPDPVPQQKVDLLYVMSLVRTKKVATARRGALVKALAIATSYPFIQIFKPVLVLALDEYFADSSLKPLAALHAALNALPLSSLPSLTPLERLVLRASDRTDLFDEKFPDLASPTGDASSPHSSSTLPGATPAGHGSTESFVSFGNGSDKTAPAGGTPFPGAGAPNGKPKDTHYFETKIAYSGVNLPVRIPLSTFPDEIGEYSLIRLVQTFPTLVPSPLHPHLHSAGAATPPIIVLFNAILTHKRVVFLGHGLPANDVATLVLAACALGSGSGRVFPGLTRRAFPYTNLVNLDNLQTIPGFIAGVCNPAFADRPSWWDVLCNIETGKISLSKDLVYPGVVPVGSGTSSKDGAGPGGAGGLSGSTGSNGGAGVGGAEGGGGTDEDVVFMDEINNAITAHYGEPVIRARFADYAARVVRQAAVGDPTIGFPTRPFAPGVLGSGLVDGDSAVAGGRVDAWRNGEGYAEFQKVWAERRAHDPLGALDLGHQLARLRTGRRLPTAEVELMIKTLASLVRTDEQVIAILGHLPPHFGGLLPLSFGLFHPSETVRSATLDLLDGLSIHPTGRKFVQALNAFHRSAYYRLRDERPVRTTTSPRVTKPLPAIAT